MKPVAYETALPVLAAHGLIPGPDGFAPEDLVAFAEQRAWGTSAEPTGRRARNRRWRATVFSRREGSSRVHAPLGGATRYGATEAEALAVALASLLRREGV